MFMPNVGYSFLTGRFVKVGSWVKISNRFYGEIAYAYFHEISSNNDIYAWQTRNKFLIGLNFFLDKAEMKTFVNCSYLRHYYHVYDYDKKIKKLYQDDKGFYSSYSCNICYKTTIMKGKFGTIIKVGVAIPGIPVLFGTTPLNMECSFYYSI
ncbi:MAG: hypothetical protein RJA07_100 [Bacteroidota bacterium]